MSLPFLAAVVIVGLGLAYRIYGRLLARQYALDADAPTPAVLREDGVGFVPTGPFYLLGQHFSAIAAAGPIAGPILACQQFGWLPCLLWIGLGVVFIGAVHDFASLVASVRHEARSIAEIVRIYMGRRAWVAMMAFIWVALVYVILAFADITASTFVGRTEELEGLALAFNPEGSQSPRRDEPVTLSFTVLGLAAPQGSHRGFVVKSKANGKLRAIVTQDNARTMPWRQEVAACASKAVRDLGVLSTFWPTHLAVSLSITFFFPRPASHFGKKGIKPSAPKYPAKKPDLSKLIRAIEDALSGIVYDDDARIVFETARKVFTLPDEPPRASISVTQVEAL